MKPQALLNLLLSSALLALAVAVLLHLLAHASEGAP